jgi:hypothetical protein
MSYVVLSSNAGGPAVGSGGNRTGVNGSTTNCGGGGCHGTGAGTTVTITVDSGTTTVATTRYKPGHSYTIKIHGSNASSLPKFGFEFAAVSGSGTSQIQAGTFAPVSSPIFADPLAGITYIEQGNAISGAPAGTYDVSFVWNAPATNVGNATLYCTLNAVDGSGTANPSDISGNTSVVLTPIVTTGVAEVTSGAAITAFPNPVTSALNLHLADVTPGTYTLQVFNLSGSIVASQNLEVAGSNHMTTLSSANWTPGLYNVVVQKDGFSKSIMVVKQ